MAIRISKDKSFHIHVAGMDSRCCSDLCSYFVKGNCIKYKVKLEEADDGTKFRAHGCFEEFMG